MKQLEIVADENISGLESFSGFANIRKLPGRNISRETLKGADALLVRSVTPVNEAILQGSTVKFVGTATSGYDHVDRDYLDRNNIQFAYAPGSNAHAVVQYVFACLAWLSTQHDFDWRNLRVGIIGGGHIGSLLAEHCRKLDCAFVIHDPYLDASYRFAQHLVSLEEVLRQNLLSIHSSLDSEGRYPSFHLLDADSLRLLGSGSILINAGRGAIVDGEALDFVLQQHGQFKCVLDVWEHEPAISMSLLHRVDLGTAHIAGYSLEGKEKGSAAIYQALVQYFKLENQPEFALSQEKVILAPVLPKDPLGQVNQTILAAYNPGQDYQSLLQACRQTEAAGIGSIFDGLRKSYSLRREFSHFQIDEKRYVKEAFDVLLALGFSYF